MRATHRSSTWTELHEPTPGCYYRVRCLVDGCDFEVIKASAHNARLAQVAHQRLRHYGHPWLFTVLPLKREEASR